MIFYKKYKIKTLLNPKLHQYHHSQQLSLMNRRNKLKKFLICATQNETNLKPLKDFLNTKTWNFSSEGIKENYYNQETKKKEKKNFSLSIRKWKEKYKKCVSVRYLNFQSQRDFPITMNVQLSISSWLIYIF